MTHSKITRDEADSRVGTVFALVNTAPAEHRNEIAWLDLFGAAVLRLTVERLTERALDGMYTSAPSAIQGALFEFIDVLPDKADELGLLPRVHVPRESIDTAWVPFAAQTAWERFATWVRDFMAGVDRPLRERGRRDDIFRALWLVHILEPGRVPRKEENASIRAALVSLAQDQRRRAEQGEPERALTLDPDDPDDIDSARRLLAADPPRDALFRGQDGAIHMSWTVLRDALERKSSEVLTDSPAHLLAADVAPRSSEGDYADNPLEILGATVNATHEQTIEVQEQLAIVRAALSRQEQQVFDHMAEEKTAEEIAEALGIPRAQVYNIQAHIRGKAMKIQNRI